MSDSDLASDLLRGAGPIAKYVLREDTEKNRRKIYYKHEKRQLPIWKEGEELISRKSLLNQHYNPPPKTEAAE